MKKITSFWSFLWYPYGRTSTEPAPRKNLRNQHVNKNQHLARISETNTWTRTGQKNVVRHQKLFQIQKLIFPLYILCVAVPSDGVSIAPEKLIYSPPRVLFWQKRLLDDYDLVNLPTNFTQYPTCQQQCPASECREEKKLKSD